MATVTDWIQGARPRTLPTALSPVIAGTGVAIAAGSAVWWKALLALVVALALVIGVNYANDYSDGVRGTDDNRVGPMRLVGSGAAAAHLVKRAAFISFGVAAIAGLALAVTTAWWIVLVGLLCIAGAWFYTGGKKPYGYLGFGEIAVFVFFGLVAVLGTEFVQTESVSWLGLLAAVSIGCFASAVLVANNLRDIPTDSVAGKVTLAVRLGDAPTRKLHLTLLVIPFVVSVAIAALGEPLVLITFAAIPMALRAYIPVRQGATGMALIDTLRDTGLAMLGWAILLAVGLTAM
ncbi:1,4-dihydroxy-2-naphthoate polyprenyltransferase [Hoyosella rhizosphaerae]|uniref:1,4-dihydroxy-2-naphthoate octaprenyltransferase n=1 Tax=Hoyosella rhizosphaerae TaxID=1755582 RepID=A0A916ULX1_9ACTN|nr:1,4-dihydroxy-2-naphthoate polyprenyltransferase [Hoyosella rhizosphaerae]MBN4925277.1 1,4-dihydroxy-2-naphthoate polyprenyltransferase [Hoyosella rhizosphaerae]GGC76572.1 1,4-dihydroxy-2-naphthoate octaprenyltransferase [Hoyosella rhizosphaerae]